MCNFFFNGLGMEWKWGNKIEFRVFKVYGLILKVKKIEDEIICDFFEFGSKC